MAKKNEIIIKITCFIAAFILWLYISNTENPAMDHVIKNVPVTLVNAERIGESGLAMLPNQDLSVSLTVKGTLAKVNSTSKDKFNIEADLSYYALKKGENKIPIILKESPNDIVILNKDNLFITLYLDDLTEKSIPVKVNLNTKTKSGFEDFTPISKPESVIVSGASSYVGKAAYAEAQVSMDSFTADLNKKATLIAKDEDGNTISSDYLTIKPSSVDVTVSVNAVKTAKIKIKTKGQLGNNLKLVNITSNPSVVSYAYNVSNNINITEINTEDIDLSKITNTTTVLQVGLKLNDNIHLIGSEGVVAVTVNTDKIIDKKFSIPITVINDSSFNPTLDITSKDITLNGAESIINKINTDNLKLLLDMSSVTKDGEQVLTLSLEGLPEGVTLAKEEEKKITLNVTKK